MLSIIASLAPKAATYLPAVGLLGLAAYQAINQHNFTEAWQSVMGAAAVVGIGHVATQAAASK
ncbi:hypothetical protein [Singulisphaera sp. PoT]|uniref:hypothetical protein n=1 Tax=Singulisphaera sp. PoT TaxID=3411797 RepID=UPI003BF5B2F2